MLKSYLDVRHLKKDQKKEKRNNLCNIFPWMWIQPKRILTNSFKCSLSCAFLWQYVISQQAFCSYHSTECPLVFKAAEYVKLSAAQKESLVKAGTFLLVSHYPALQTILHYRTKFQALLHVSMCENICLFGVAYAVKRNIWDRDYKRSTDLYLCAFVFTSWLVDCQVMISV